MSDTEGLVRPQVALVINIDLPWIPVWGAASLGQYGLVLTSAQVSIPAYCNIVNADSLI